jgi:hypothetical protein
MRIFLALLLGLVLCGCASRSISDSGNRTGQRYGSNDGYIGELSEADVLATETTGPISNTDITAALNLSREPLRIPRGHRLMLVQSGAELPDSELLAAFNQAYRTIGFSGLPVQRAWNDRTVAAPNATSSLLRMTAAQGGYETLLVVWGRLETQQQASVTKAVSWVPVVGWVLPDQSQKMRIRLHCAVIDVASGRWELFEPTEFEDDADSAILTRESSDQSQVARLKSLAYRQAAAEFVRRYAS